MKNLFVFAAVLLMVSFLGCQDTKENNQLPDVSSFKSIGTQISLETGLRWMDALNKKQNTQSRGEYSPYQVSASELEILRTSVPYLVGVAFHHAIDNAGVHHFVIIPVDLNLNIWSPQTEGIYVDANTNTTITRNVARQWTENYKQAHPNDIWFHFFGSDIFDEIASIPYFTTLQIEPALNDLNLTPQLLLIVEDETEAITNGRGKYAQSTMVYDASSPCPPCPVGD